MTSRIAGDVKVISSATDPVYVTQAANSADAPVYVIVNARATSVAADTATSGGVVFMSVNTTGASKFMITNSGSINIYIAVSPNGIFFQPSAPVQRVGVGVAGAPSSTVECVSASTIARFSGMYQAIQVVANSGSGVYRAHLLYR